MDLSVYHCGYEKCRLVRMEETEGGRHYLFYYIVSGEGSLRVQNETEDEKIYSLPSGRGFLIDVGGKERYQILANGNWEYAWIELDLDLKCEKYVNRAVHYIEQNYFRPISVEELAKKCWRDRSYFGKVFKSVMGQSPQSFLISFRMEKASEELMTGDTPIGDVGAAVGYPNRLNFSRAFKGVYGISPREYRQRNMIIGR